MAEELAVKYHPTAGSAARGAASGATFGASELAIKAQTKRDEERAKNEQYYQENKNKTAETVGELAGAFASFGATAGATDRLGAKVVSKVAPNAAERLAETKGVQLLAKRGVNKAVEKGLVGEASEELIKQVGKEKAKKIVAAVGNDIIQNATTGLLYDFNKASAAHEIGSKEWWKEMGRSAAFNAAVTGGIAGGAILGGNKRLAAEEAMNLFNRKNKQAAEDAFKNYMWAERGVGAGNASKNKGRLFGESLDDRLGIANKAEVEEVAETTAKGTKPAAANLKATEEVAEQGARSVEDINRELDAVYDEIARNGDMPEERLSSLLKRADDLNAERNALEEAANSKDYNVSLNRKRKTDVALPNERAAESVEPQDVPSMRQKEYTLKVKYKSGKTYTRKVNALSDTEALDIITKNKGVDNARIVGSSEITPKGTKSAAENLQTKELSQEEKRNNILNFIGEGDEAATAVEATAKGAKPEAKILTSPYEETIANNPKTVDELGDHIGVKHEKVSNKEKTHDFWSSFRTKFVDSLDAYEQWNKQFLKTDPEKWDINNGAIDKLRRHQGMAVKSIDTNQLGWNGQPLKNEDGSIAKSLKAIYDGLDGEKENLFERYLLLRHAPARIAEGKPIFKGTFENADKCIEEAEKILADN
ncbi:MAG: hypothetical protein IIT64_08735, partial [Bacteroidaceae bacterium]|nr:hypothetical protein [Bacteroidaceae bacterium]